MDRRRFVQGVLAAALAQSSNSFAQAVPLPPVLDGESAKSSNIQLAVRRFDRGSGLSTFNGGIPLQPGQLMPNATGNVAIFRNGVELPIYVEALSGVHKDGSLKAIKVQTRLEVNDTDPVDILLTLNKTPTKGSFTPDTVDYHWMQAPRLVYSSNASHNCAARTALLPLVPMSELPNSWQTFLTLGADQFDSEVSANGTASYNWVYGWCCRFLMTGDPVPLVHAMATMATNSPNTYGGVPLSYYIPGDGVHSVEGEPDNYFNPDGFPGVTSGSSGNTTEWYDCSLDCFLMYYLTGWELPRRILIHRASRELHQYEATNLYPQYNDPRFAYRFATMWCVTSYVMGNDVTVRRSSGVVANVMNADTSITVQQCADNAAAWPRSDFRYGVWGSCMTADTVNEGAPAVGYVPAFQYEVMMPWLMSHYLNIDSDSRIPAALSRVGEYLRSQFVGPFPHGDGAYYLQPNYYEADPATISQADYSPAESGDYAYPYMEFPALAYAYAYTGNIAFRDAVDNIVKIPNPDMGGEARTRKLQGQIFCMAYHAAAYRNGVSPTGWR